MNPQPTIESTSSSSALGSELQPTTPPPEARATIPNTTFKCLKALGWRWSGQRSGTPSFHDEILQKWYLRCSRTKRECTSSDDVRRFSQDVVSDYGPKIWFEGSPRVGQSSYYGQELVYPRDEGRLIFLHEALLGCKSGGGEGRQRT